MNRRQILKTALFAPLLGLFKSRKLGASTGLTEIPPTSGTSSEGEILYQGPYKEKHEPITTVPLDEKWSITSMGISYPDGTMTIYGYKI